MDCGRNEAPGRKRGGCHTAERWCQGIRTHCSVVAAVAFLRLGQTRGVVSRSWIASMPAGLAQVDRSCSDASVEFGVRIQDAY
jgi:hypothetical protein